MGSDDTAEFSLVLANLHAVSAPVDAAVLSRARWHGWRSRAYFPEWSFEEVEAELRAAWLLNGEAVRWMEVRHAVREGYDALGER